MAFNIETFKTRGLQQGGARPSLFQVNLTMPFVESGLSPRAAADFTFLCRATSIPASTVASIDVPYFGRTIKVNGDRTFADWNITVMNDENYTVRNAFEAWHNSINTIRSNVRTAPQTQFKTDATVIHYSKAGSDARIKEYKFVGVFPVNVAEMSLDWEATNQIQTFGVTFAYDYWIPVVINGSAIPIGGGVQ